MYSQARACIDEKKDSLNFQQIVLECCREHTIPDYVSSCVAEMTTASQPSNNGILHVHEVAYLETPAHHMNVDPPVTRSAPSHRHLSSGSLAPSASSSHSMGGGHRHRPGGGRHKKHGRKR